MFITRGSRQGGRGKGECWPMGRVSVRQQECSGKLSHSKVTIVNSNVLNTLKFLQEWI